MLKQTNSHLFKETRINFPRVSQCNRILFALLAAMLLLTALAGTAAAQTTPEFQRDDVKVAYPDEIRFNLEFQSSGEVKRVTLLYATNAQTCQNASARQSVDFETTGGKTTVEWIWKLRDTGGLPPGAQLTWQWEVVTSAGETFTSPSRQLTIEDSRYTWHSTAYGGVSVYWNQGDAAFGQRLQEIGIQSLARLAREMGIDAPASVRLMVYPGADEVRGAGINLPGWTGGFAVPEYGTVMLGIAPQEIDWAATIIPHELAHLVSDQRVFNCKGAEMPTWLSEGISVAAEGPQNPEERRLVLDALEQGRLPTLRSLANGFAANSQRANLSYAQSGMLVRYFINKYGSGGMDRLLQAIQDGQTVDRALESEFRLDTEGLDADWRASLGYAAAGGTSLPAATRTLRPKATTIPTLALWTQAPLAATATTAPTAAATAMPPTQPATPAATATAPTPPSRPAAWPYILAGLLMLAVAVYLGIRRSFRR